MKRSNKQRVMEFIQNYSKEFEHEEYPKISTNFLSEKLDLQRTNLSSLLNQLVKEGKLTKQNGRPVLYQLLKEEDHLQDSFTNLIGWNGSLTKAVNLAKAAVLYPGGKSSVLLTAEKGCETSYFIKLMHEFSKETKVLQKDAPFLVFECKTFMEDSMQRHHILFGDEESEGLLSKAKQGILVLKHVEVLSGMEQEMLMNYNRECILICYMRSDANPGTLKLWSNQMDFHAELLPLRERSKDERFQLMERFFQNEAGKIQKKIEVETSILHSLLLYDATDNIRSLKNDIHTGCANCYARSHRMKNKFVELLFSDFPNYIRKGLIYYKSEKEEIDQIIVPNFKYAFGEQEVLKSNATSGNQNIYQTIDARKKKLKEQSIREDEINSIMSVELQQEFQDYMEQLCKRVQNKSQLELIVSNRLIMQVENFLKRAEDEMNCKIEEKIFFALCLHVNACIVKVSGKQRISNEEISGIIGKYPVEYQLAKEFVQKMETDFYVHLDVDEIIFTMLFLIQGMSRKEKAVVSTLIVMHGDSSATSIANVVNVMANEKNTYAYDLKLEQNIKVAYEELKEKIKEVNQGKGIILIYDMGSIKTMAETIAEETGIQIKSIELPVTLLGVASSNRAAMGGSLEDVSEYLTKDLNVGEYPFSRVNQLFSGETKELEELLKENVTESEDVEEFENQALVEDEGIQDVFEYLEAQFAQMDMQRMRMCLRTFLYALEETMDIELDEDKKIGLIVHIVCLVDKLQQHQSPSVNFIASKILGKQPILVQEVKTLLEPIETEFEININDTEIATIISIVQQR